MSTFSNINISIGKVINTVNTIADLRNYKPRSIHDGDTVIVSAGAILGDRNGGTFVWVEGLTDADDGADTIRPVFAIGSGRWVKMFGKGDRGATGADSTVPGPRGPIGQTGPQGDGLATVMAPGGSALVGYRGRTVAAKLTETVSVKDFGATGGGIVSDLTPLRAALAAVQADLSDGSRDFSGEIHLPAGRYLVDSPLNLAPDGPVAGLTISGAGAGSTEIVFATASATIMAPGSRGITFRDITFRSLDPYVETISPGAKYGVGLKQSSFTISHSFGQDSAALRSWRFERCDWAGFYRCFNVTGVSMCSEFYFDKCGFSQCYIGMDNSNDQAVNWNFVNCNWENEGLDLTGTSLLLKDATLFKLQKGTSVKWTGGSIIWFGKLVLFNMKSSFDFNSTTHGLTFDGIRCEMCDDNGTVQPMFDRVEDGSYVNPGNAPNASLINSQLIMRGAVVAANQTLFKVWDNAKFVVDNCVLEGGKVKAVYSAFTAANTGTFRLSRTTRLGFEEDTSGRTADHIRHAVVMEPDTRGGEVAIPYQQAMSTIDKPFYLDPRTVAVRGQTGSLPNGGDTILLVDDLGNSIFKPGTIILRVIVRRFSTAGYPLTVQLKKADDTTLYGEAVLANGSDRAAYGEVNVEVGFQVPADDKFILKAVGTPEVVKGVILIEYL